MVQLMNDPIVLEVGLLSLLQKSRSSCSYMLLANQHQWPLDAPHRAFDFFHFQVC